MQPLPDPSDNPRIVLAGKEYEVKFSGADVVALKKDHGINIMSGAGMQFVGEEAIEKCSIMLSYGLAHTGEDFTPDKLLRVMDFSQWAEALVCVMAAQKKAADHATSVLEQARNNGIIPKPKTELKPEAKPAVQ